MDSVASILQTFGSTGVSAIVKEILYNERLLSKVAEVSYLHKNGFYKIILGNEKDFKLRLHIWMPNAIAYETLHSHRWYFASTIIAGKLESEIWIDSASPTAKLYDDYLYLGKHAKPLLLGKAKVELAYQTMHVAGDIYTLEPNILHRIMFDSNEIAATLMCRSASSHQWARNVIVNDIIPDATPHYMTPNELYIVLQKYLMLTAIKI